MREEPDPGLSEQDLGLDDTAELVPPDHSEPGMWLAKHKSAEQGGYSARPRIDFDAWQRAYSEFKPDRWRPLLLFAPGDSAAILQAVQQVGDDDRARELFVLALCWIRVGGESVAWWRDRDLSFASLLNAPKMHFLSLGAAAENANVDPAAIAASGFDDATLAMAQTAVNDPDFEWEK